MGAVLAAPRKRVPGPAPKRPMTCDACGKPAVAVAPGTDEERCTVALLRRGIPDRSWCLAHWPARGPS
jgi:hypothetical protein